MNGGPDQDALRAAAFAKAREALADQRPEDRGEPVSIIGSKGQTIEFWACERCGTEPVLNTPKQWCERCALKLWWESFVPLRYRRWTWDTLAREWPPELMAGLEQWFDLYTASEIKPHLGLIGDVGNLKTTACFLLARRIREISRFRTVVYTTADEMLRDVSRRRFETEDPIDDYSDADVLILDDLGVKEDPSDTWRSDLHAVIERRHREGLPVLWTSNLSPSGLQGVVDRRDLDRLSENSVVLEVPLKSRRKLAS